MVSPSSFFVGRVLVSPSRNVIASDGGECSLEPRLMDILVLLASRPGEVVSRKDLIEAGWPGVAGADEGLTKAISLLRRALGDAAASSNVIQTIPKRGYRLVAPVRSGIEPAPERRPATPQAARGALVTGAAVLILLVFAAGVAGGMRRMTAGEPVRKILVADTASTGDHRVNHAGLIKRRIKLMPDDRPAADRRTPSTRPEASSGDRPSAVSRR